MVIAQDLIEFGKEARLAICGRFIERLFSVDQKLWCALGCHKVQLAVFMNFLSRTKPERFVLDERPAGSQVVIPAQEVRNVASWNIGTIEHAVPMVGRGEAMQVVAAGFGNDVDHSPGGMPELGFVSGGDDLEFRNGVLVELRGGATIELILVG